MLIFYAIPFFLLLLVIEWAYDTKQKTGYYRINDTVTSLSIGVLSRTKGFITRYLSWMTYPLLLSTVQVMSLPNHFLTWILAFLLYDLCYYWSHRFQHTINLLWGVHVVHHSSEEYNLSTALRQTSTGVLFGSLFYIPLAVLGIPLHMLIIVGSLNLIYQFWVHTRFIPKLGWLEWIFITPSNHRVHHAQNWIYIDKNFGGVFIIWDRMFGTFQEELDEEPVVYGISKPLRSWNPFWANFEVYTQLFKDAWHTQSWRDKLKVFYGPTGWRPDDVKKSHPIPHRKLADFKKYDTKINPLISTYILLTFLPTLAYSIWFMLSSSQFNTAQALLYFSPFGLSFLNNNYLLQGRSWAIMAEWMKWGFLFLIPWLAPWVLNQEFLIPQNHWLLGIAGCVLLWTGVLMALKKELTFKSP